MACVNRAPEGTFGAAVAEVGVFDLLKFPQFTGGKNWISEYGNPDDPEDFYFIFPISPLHSPWTEQEYPPVLLMTADNDTRVPPLHSFKLAALLQNNRPDDTHSVFLRINKNAGHGPGKPTDQRIRELADKYCFIAKSMDLIMV
ncbi:hypothetical protein HGRIS_001441 [Hohenbuehelia grisea]|uniref:Prolyl endopeptidase n=1 Tax=Hohenbuehelia grisea TaxID=104357 RepID=A0ABR3JQE0_9AGAR